MFRKSRTSIDGELRRAILEMEDQKIDSERYEEILGRLERLHKVRQEMLPEPYFSPDAVLTSSTHLIGILLILHYENLNNIVTSKAIGFVNRLR